MKRITGNKPKVKKNNKPKISKKLIIIFIILAFVVLFISIRIFPRIRIIEIKIEKPTYGENKITKEQIISLSKIKVGDRLYKERRSQIEQRVEENPYIKSAKVKRDISGKISIEISQRQPEYMINYSGEYIYIDKEGYVLEVNPNNNGTPIIIGFSTDFSDLTIGNSKIRLDQKDLEKLDTINNILATFKSNNIENIVNLIDITDPKNFILHLDNDGKEIHLGDGSNINTKVLYMKKILETEAENNGIIYIDGNLDEGYVYFKEQ